MLRAIVDTAIRHRGMVLALAMVLVAYGAYRLAGAGLDIFPEFAPRLVVVQTEAPGLTAEEVETRVTLPIERALGGLIGLDHVRSESIQGLSIVTVVFAESSDTYRNRNQVAERLATARGRLPPGVGEPIIAPLASSSATVRTLGLIAANDDPVRLREVTRTVVVPRLLALDGIADVNVFGGAERALVVEPDPVRLAQRGVTTAQVAAALAQLGARPAFDEIVTGQQQLGFTLAGDLPGLDALRAVTVNNDARGIVRVGDVATVVNGAMPRISAAQIMGRPAVVMMVIGQFGANTLTVSQDLDAVLADLAPVLAARDIELVPSLFTPANYIVTAIDDISRHLVLGGVLVLVVLLAGLYDLRTALISALAIPLSLLAAVTLLVEAGVNLNVLVIGGLAIALGEVVDDAVIDTENIFRRLREAPPGADIMRLALDASLEVRGSVVYATVIVALVFVPLLTLGGVSGRLFAPLGVAYILAVLVSLVVAMTVTPALCVMLLGRIGGDARPAPLFRLINPAYGALVRALARRPAIALAVSASCLVFVALVLPQFGARFLPELREGHYIVHTTGLPGTSLDESIRTGSQLTDAFLDIDGVRSVSQWAGRAERGADTYGSHYSEYEVALEPMSGTRQQAVLDALRDILAGYPGLNFEANTFLTERIDETISGYTAPVVINLYGRDLEVLDALARQVARLTASVPGAAGVHMRSAHTTPQLHVRLRPHDLARLGVAPGVATRALADVYGAEPLTQFFDRGVEVPLVMRLDAATRNDPAAVQRLEILRHDNTVVRLGDVADVTLAGGRYNVLHRDGQRLQVVTSGVRGRDPGSFLDELRRRVMAVIEFPPGTHPEFTGAAVEQAAARETLIVHALIAGMGVLALIQLAVGRFRYLVLILVNLPFSLAGGVLAVMAAGGVVSVGSVVGFVTLFGITVRNSIMLVSHYTHLVTHEGCRWDLATVERGARERLPAILMTALVTALAMLPLTIDSDNAGREIMGPMAAIIIGGLASSTLLNLVVMPALLFRFGRFGEVARV